MSGLRAEGQARVCGEQRQMKTLWLAATFAALLTAEARPAAPIPDFPECAPGQAPSQQQKCDDQISAQVGSGSRITSLPGGWQLVRTKHPAGGSEAVSAMHVVDAAKSDVGLAGLSLQCGPQGVGVILVMLERMSRSERPRVTLTPSSGATAQMEASVAQSGETLLLPQEASRLAAGEWQKASKLSVQIEERATLVRGEIPIDGLGAALQALNATCPQPRR